MYLELIEKKRVPNTHQLCFVLSEKGKQVFNINLIDRQKEFVKLILSHLVFKETLKLFFENGEMPSKNRIVQIMKISKLYKVGSESTYLRRASTITSWINWIINQIEE